MATVTAPVRTSRTRKRPPRPFTVEHFRIYSSRLVFDDGEQREPEDWQLDFVRDVFRGYDLSGLTVGPRRGGSHDTECWLLVPEANGKTTLTAELALYGCDWADSPWIPVGASTRDQAKVLYHQAKGFVMRTPGLSRRFECYDGYKAIRPLDPHTGERRPGEGIEICPWDPNSNDGAIPYPYFICDELHRHPDLTLWRLWKGKHRKRGCQGIGISTAGEPGSEFEQTRDRIRERAVSRQRRYGGTHYRGGRAVMYEFKLEDPQKATDPKAVAAVNPLSTNTAESFAADLSSPSFDLGDWKRLKCNIAARATNAGISDEDWARLACDLTEIPAGEHIMAGLDVAWSWDTTAITPLWPGPEFRLLSEAIVITPPRDGSSLHPDRIKEAFFALVARNPLSVLVMDTSGAKDLAAWFEDDHEEGDGHPAWRGVTVIDRSQSNDAQIEDYVAFSTGMRDGTLKRVKRCPLLTRHAMNAVRLRLPSGSIRFGRPSQTRSNVRKQDQRVIDALTAAGMVVQHSTRAEPEPTSVYEERFGTGAT